MDDQPIDDLLARSVAPPREDVRADIATSEVETMEEIRQERLERSRRGLGVSVDETPDSRVRSSLWVGLDTDPDRAAAVQRLAKQLGTSPDIVAAGYEDLKKRYSLSDREIRGWTEDPVFENFLSDPDNAAVVHDDKDALRRLSMGVFNYMSSPKSGAPHARPIEPEAWRPFIKQLADREARRSQVAFDPSISIQERALAGTVLYDDISMENEKDRAAHAKAIEDRLMREIALEEEFISRQDQIGAIENFGMKIGKNPIFMVGILGSVNAGRNALDLYDAASRMEKGIQTQEDMLLLLRAARLEEAAQRRGTSFLGGASDIVLDAMPFATELALTRGGSAVAEGLEGLTKLTYKELLRRSFKAVLSPKSWGRMLASTAGQTALLAPFRLPGRVATAMMPDYDIVPTEEGTLRYEVKPGTGQSFWVALPVEFAKDWIENATERLGELPIMHGLDRFVDKAFDKAVFGWWMSKNPGMGLVQFHKWLAEAGVGSVPSEMAEEQLSMVLNGIANMVTPEGTGFEPFRISSFKELGTQAVGFLVAPAARSTAARIGSVASTEMHVRRAASELREAGVSAKESKLIARDPERLVGYINRTVAGTERDTVYLPANKWQTYWQERGAKPEEEAERVLGPGGKELYLESVRTGALIPVPTGEYVVKIEATEHGEYWNRNMQPDPSTQSLADLGLDLAEVERQATATVEGAAEKNEQEQKDRDAARELRNLIQARMQKLVAAGAMSRAQAREYLRWEFRNWMQLSKAAQKDPVALFQKYPTLFARGAKVIEGTMPSAAVEQAVQAIQAGQIPTEAQALGPSLADFILENGGIKADAEVAKVIPQQVPQPVPTAEAEAEEDEPGEQAQEEGRRRDLFQPNGMSRQALARAAVQAGYLTSEDEFLPALSRELGGSRVYSGARANQDLTSRRNALLGLRDRLRALGLDPLTVSPQEALKALQTASVEPATSLDQALGLLAVPGAEKVSQDGQGLSVPAVLFQLKTAPEWVEKFLADPRTVEALGGKAGVERFGRDLLRTAAVYAHLDIVPEDVGGESFRDNMDPLFKLTFDLSTLCPQQDQYVATIRALEAVYKDVFPPEVRAEVGNIIAGVGEDVACWYCYGQAARDIYDYSVWRAVQVINLVAKNLRELGKASLADMAKTIKKQGFLEKAKAKKVQAEKELGRKTATEDERAAATEMEARALAEIEAAKSDSSVKKAKADLAEARKILRRPLMTVEQRSMKAELLRQAKLDIAEAEVKIEESLIEAAKKALPLVGGPFAATGGSMTTVNEEGKPGALMEALLRNSEALVADGRVLDAVHIGKVVRGEIDPVDGLEAGLAAGIQSFAQGASGANAVKGYSGYKDSVLRINEVWRKFFNKVGGLRLNSQTDFRAWHIIDLAQLLAHAQTVGLGAHVYTKEPWFVAIFGRTGIRFNLSMEAVTMPDGTVVWNEMEGYPTTDYVAGRRRLKKPMGFGALAMRKLKNIGTMLMAADDKQFLWGLNNPEVDMMIPLHTGRIPKNIVESKGAVDFASWQHEDWDKHEERMDKSAVRKIKDGYRVKLADGSTVDVLMNPQEPKFVGSEKAEKQGHPLILQDAHQNSKARYLEICEKLGVKPKWAGLFLFPKASDPTKARERYRYLSGRKQLDPAEAAELQALEADKVSVIDHPEYMKLVRDTAKPELEATPIDVSKINWKAANEFLQIWINQKGDRVEPQSALVRHVAGELNGKGMLPRAIDEDAVAQAFPPPPQAEAPLPAGDAVDVQSADHEILMASLFSGGGIVEAGLKGLVRPMFAVEINALVGAQYRAAHGDHVRIADVRNVDMGGGAGAVYLHASPVCKNFSAAKAVTEDGEQPVDVETAQATADAIRTIRPRIFTLENVADYQDSDAMRIIEQALTEGGYKWDAKVYDAADYGAATSRKRLLVRAVRDGELPPDPATRPPADWSERIEDLIPDMPDSTVPEYMSNRLEQMGINWRNPTQPIIVMGGSASATTIPMAEAGGPAPTIKATPKETARILMPDGTVKAVTPRALARLMGIPDSYPLPKDRETAITIIGNGVPVELTQAVIGPLVESVSEDRAQMAQPLPGGELAPPSSMPQTFFGGQATGIDQTDTPEFKAWFGDSKVVDEQGKPLVVYHGGTATTTIGPMGYATPLRDAAETYSRNDRGGRVTPLFMSIRNPATSKDIGNAAASLGLDISNVSMYATLSRESFAGAESIIAELKRQGFDGVHFAVGEDFSPDGDAIESWAAFSPTQIKSATANVGTFSATDPNILHQPERNDTARGSISFGNNNEVLVSFLEGADASTYIHEMSHLFLKVMSDLAMAPEATDKIKAEMAVALKYLGVNSVQEIGVEQQEKWAKSVELYLIKNEAPSIELRGVFASMRKWMGQVYEKIRDYFKDIQLTPEVTALFDRMLASDAAIARAAAENAVGSVVGEAGDLLTAADAAEYAKARAAHREMAEGVLRAKLLSQMKRPERRAYQKRRREVRDEVERDVRAMHIYNALAILQRGKRADGRPLADGLEPFKIDRQSLVGRMGEEWVRNLPPFLTAKEGGIDVGMAGEMLGYPDTSSFLQAIATAEPMNQRIERETDERLAAEGVGDVEVTDADQDVVTDALYNEKYADLLELELQLMAKNKLPLLKRIVQRAGLTAPSKAAVRAEAARILSRKKVGEIRPALYRQTAQAKAREAMAALVSGDFDALFSAKKQQFLAMELYRAASEMQKRVADFRAWRKRLWKASVVKTRMMDYVQAARYVCGIFGLGRRVEEAKIYIDRIAKYDIDGGKTLQGMLDGLLPKAADWKTVDMATFDTMVGIVKAYWNQSRDAKLIEIEGKKMTLEQAEAPCLERLAQLTENAEEQATVALRKTNWQKFKMQLLRIKSALRRVEQWAEAMDGRFGGPFRKYIFTPVRKVTDAYRLDKKKYISKYRDILNEVKPFLTRAPIVAKELNGVKFDDMAHLLGALLHMGNQSNLSKLLRGYRWGEFNEYGNLDRSRWDAFIQRLVDEGTLRREHFDFCQKVWDLCEEMKPAAQRSYHRMYGTLFNEITAEGFSFTFKDGTTVAYKGGYVPAKCDVDLVNDAAVREDAESIENMNNSFMFPTTGKGFTFSRMEGYAAPLLLDLSLVSGHIDQVLRFTHIEPVVKEVGRLLTHSKLRRALDAYDESICSRMLIPFLQRAALQLTKERTKFPLVDKFFSGVRSRSGLGIMFANIGNTIQNITGVSIGMLKVRPGKFMRNGLWKFVKDPRGISRMISDKSSFMATRISTQMMEIQNEVDKIIVQPNAYQTTRDFFTRHGYFLQSATQSLVDNVVWLASYEQASETMDEAQAVEYADSAVRQTQGSFDPEDMSSLETSTPFVRFFLMFTSYFNMQANTLLTEFGNTVRELGFRGGKARAFYVYFYGFLIPSFVGDMIMEGLSWPPDDLDEDDDDTYLWWFIAKFFGSQARTLAAFVPGAGPAALTTMNYFDDRVWDDRIMLSPAIRALEAASKAPYDIYRLATSDDDVRPSGPIRDIFSAITLLSGIPLTPLSKPIGFIADVETGHSDVEGPIEYTQGLVTGRAPRR